MQMRRTLIDKCE